MARQDTHNTVFLTLVDQRITINLLYMVTREMQVMYEYTIQLLTHVEVDMECY